jgi:hypothetical protein
MALLGVAAPRLKARAIGWASAPVNSSADCITPVAVPFTQLMYKINVHRGIANTPDTLGLYRPFDQVSDLDALNNMSPLERTFSLKIGSGRSPTPWERSQGVSGRAAPKVLGYHERYLQQSTPVPGASAYKVTCRVRIATRDSPSVTL